MRKTIFLVVLTIALPLFSVSAAASLTTVNTGAPAVSIYPSTFDNLAMDFTVKRNDGSADTLRALTLQNDGTARDFYDIAKVVVWADAGAAGFQGMGVDEKLGEAIRYETAGYWYLSGLSKTVPAEGLRLFVSFESTNKGAMTTNRTIQMKVPALSDLGTAGQFDLGDNGLFLGGVTGPAAAILNPNTQTTFYSEYDVRAPKTVITAPHDGDLITASSYKITGIARDQGGSTLALLKISISSAGSGGSWADVTSTGANFETWEYNWTGFVDGSYTIKTYGADWLGNTETVGEGITVTVDQTATSAPSATLSTVSAAPTALLADGIAKALVTVTVKSASGGLLSGKMVDLSSSRLGDKIKIVKALTGSDGVATFEVSSVSAGTSTLTATVGSIVLGQKPVLTFSAATLHAGDLLRGSATAVYYLGADGKKYLFPTSAVYSSWYSDFSGIKTVANTELSSRALGGNVTVRPGKLVQLVSMDTPWRVMDPKVYAVGEGGVLRWVKTGAVAVAIFGSDWEKKIVPLPEVFSTNYTFGANIESSADYNLASEEAVATISGDKGLE